MFWNFLVATCCDLTGVKLKTGKLLKSVILSKEFKKKTAWKALFEKQTNCCLSFTVENKNMSLL